MKRNRNSSVWLWLFLLSIVGGHSSWAQVERLIPATRTVQAFHMTDWELSLNGDWRFANLEEKRAGKWNNLPVPGNWNCFTEYADYVGDAWYQRDFVLPSQWADKRIYLQFDAVYDIADVWWDDTYLGQHVGGYTPFEFDVTELMRTGETHKITLKANNEHVVGAWFQWGGISRDVRLIARQPIRLLRQKIEPVLDIETGTAQIKLIANVENNSNQPQNVTIVGVIRELGDVGFRIRGTVQANSTEVLSKRIMLNTSQTRVWHFDDPQLYHLQTSLWQHGKVLDQLNDRFGIRKVDIKTDGLYLNGEKVRLMGYNRVHDHRAYGNSEPRHLVRADVDLMKRSGANFSRIMHAPSAPELLDYCDEKGLLVWAEIPMWQKIYRTPMATAADVQKAPDLFPGTTMREMIERDWNHPCIIGWSPGNELRWEASKYVAAMRPWVKGLDPTRFYANIHDQGFKNISEGGYKNLDYHHVDMLFMNKYGNDETKIKAVRAQHESIPDLPIFVSEYGQKRNESLNHSQDFTSLWETLGKEPYVIGGAHWTFNDYRSYWKGTPSSQNRDWGIVDVWRNPKVFFYQMSKVNAPIRSMDALIQNQKATLTIQPRSSVEIPSFTLRGYSWAFELLDQQGKVLEGNIYDLAHIAPDDPPITRTIDWKTTKAKTLVLSLISKTGYTVAEVQYDVATKRKCPLPSFPELEQKQIRKVLALDGSFMIGVTSQAADKGLEVRYGTASGKYSESLHAPVSGAIRVRGLKNGQAYYGQVRRLKTDGPGEWSNEFRVIPDGGLLPRPPEILGVIKCKTKLAARIKPQEKIESYEVILSTGETKELTYADPGLLILPINSQSLSVINAYGKSAPIKLETRE